MALPVIRMTVLSPKVVNELSKRLLMLLVSVAIYLAFDYVYSNQIYESYAKYGFSVRPLDGIEYLLLFLFYLAPVLVLPVQLRRPSDICLWLLYLLSYSPALFMAFYSLEPGLWHALQFHLYLLTGLAVVYLARMHRISLRLGAVIAKQSYLEITFLVLSIVICFYLYGLTQFGLSLDMATLHERRLMAREEGNLLGGYLISQARAVIYVFGIYLFLTRKRTAALLLVLCLAVIGFSYDGTKTSILLPVALLFLGIFFVRSGNFIWVLLAPFIVIVLAILEIKLIGTHIISEYIVRRSYAVTGLISTAYFDYFSSHPFVLMTDSIGRLVAEPVYDLTTGYLIGKEYFDDPLINANTNLWWGGYANFGFVGILISSAIAGFILGLIDNITREKFFILGCMICAYLGLKWIEQFIHTSLLSGGILALVALVFVAAHSRELQDKWGGR
jgi:O-antigen polymerase